MAAIYEKSHVLARKLREYLNKITGVDPVLLDSYNQHLSDVENMDAPDALDSGTSLRILFKYGAEIAAQIKHVCDAYEIAARYNPVAIGNRAKDGSSYSSVFLTTIADLWQEVETAHSTLMASDLTPWKIVIRPLTTIAELDDALKLSKQCIDVYVALIDRTLQSYLPDKDFRKRIFHDLELLKTDVLVDAVKLTKREPPCNVIQDLIQRYNLVPDSISKPWAFIAKELGLAETATPTAETFKKAAAALKVGLIVINKSTTKPIEHNLWTLFGAPINKLQGVCNENIKRTQTINQLTLAPLAAKLPPILITPENASEYYVIETLDGVTWRLMVPWYNKPSPIKASWLPIKADARPSHRLTAYNMLINDEIMKHVGPKLIQDQLSRDEQKIAESHWANVRNLLVQKIVNYIIKKGKSAIKADSTYSYILMLIAREVTLPNMPVDADAANLMLREIAITYYSDYGKLHSDLKKNADELYGDGPGRADEREYLSKVFNELLELFISRKSNIYDEIDRKVALVTTIAKKD